MKVKLPALYAIDVQRNGNWIRQLLSPVVTIEAAVATYTRGRLTGTILKPESDPSKEILIKARAGVVPESVFAAIYQETPIDGGAAEADCTEGKWVKHPKRMVAASREQCTQAAQKARESWPETFRFLKEDPGRNVSGLRNPQIGAVHAVFAHWSVSEEAGTVVMPTGTGKTETMLSILIARPCDKILAVVPTDAFAKVDIAMLQKEYRRLHNAAHRRIQGIIVDVLHAKSQITEGAGKPFLGPHSGNRFENRNLQISYFHDVPIMPPVFCRSQLYSARLS